MKNNNTIYVSFHIGRGGQFNNQGYRTFTGEENFQELLSRCSDVCDIISTDEDGNQLPDEDWYVEDSGSNVILTGRENIEAMTGVLDFDGEYDTDYVTTTDDLSTAEEKLLIKAYEDDEYMSDELKEFIRSIM